MDASSKSPEDKLTLKFVGNRVDLVLPASGGGAKILIDGQPPSKFNLYHATRPKNLTDPRYWRTATLRRIFEGPDMLPETWTLVFTEMELDAEKKNIVKFKYKLSGSVTGEDGEGSNEAVFNSRSGRIMLKPQEFNLIPSQAPVEIFKPGLTLEWDVVPDFLDEVKGDPSVKLFRYITVADGLPCGEHELAIIPTGDGLFSINSIEIHCPPLGLPH